MGKKKDSKEEKELKDKESVQQETNEISIEEQLKSEVVQEKDKFLRLFAEFENYKKRTSNNSLTQKGLSHIEVKNGETFDVELHEAITQIPAPKEDLKGKIIDVIEQGYKLGDKVIRYPRVVVGQ